MYALTIDRLQKTYSNGVEALRAVDLRVKEGDFFALLGPNGAGKTTIIGILSTLVRKTAGTVKIFEHDMDLDLTAAKSCLGIVPQEFNFYQFEKVINIVVNQAGYYGISRKPAKALAQQYLEQLGLWQKRNEVARTLSGGMKRRLMIARALMNKPRILLLDEPTAGVDIELRRATWDFLRELNSSGTTIVLTTHYLEEAELLCNGVAIINKGVILENTEMKELLKQLPYEKVILDLQTPILLERLPEMQGVKFELLENGSLEVTMDNSMSFNNLFEALSAKGIYVSSMRNKTNRLEELFLSRIAQHG